MQPRHGHSTTLFDARRDLAWFEVQKSQKNKNNSRKMPFSILSLVFVHVFGVFPPKKKYSNYFQTCNLGKICTDFLQPFLFPKGVAFLSIRKSMAKDIWWWLEARRKTHPQLFCFFFGGGQYVKKMRF